MRSFRVLLATSCVALLSRALGAQSVDPIAADPAPRDTAFRASFAELALTSGGARMNAFMLVAQGKGPHPLVVLLHGYPGNERNIDIAQALRRAGTNVLYIDYRGSWGSGGTFTFANAQADVAAAVRWARQADTARTYRVDPRRVALVGHSMGGWLALLGTAADPSITCVAALEFADMAREGSDTSFATYTRWLTAPGAPLRGDARAMTASLRAHPEWRLVPNAARIATRPVLLLDDEENPYHADFAAALRGAGARRLTERVWDTDHAFDDRRVELARTVVGWTKTACGF
ncbi:lipoprotein (plasmid) [Gemmatirosa kalamazoonensis]|uniref:Lipoprotein n=1 Tax=Gemmatirosa kalamazoonensis TaxID=861299 RepID=W0RT02_9BACT|nr:alpha/beta fold hydrolase [Gemmatirosa kalamazoonensis]AHG93816.1 lipoprotein [Gemmatirosa kalamazoonensis]